MRKMKPREDKLLDQDIKTNSWHSLNLNSSLFGSNYMTKNPSKFLSILYCRIQSIGKLVDNTSSIEFQICVFFPIPILVLATITYLDYGGKLLTGLPVLTVTSYLALHFLPHFRIFFKKEIDIFPWHLLLKVF